jgi:predicted branched-subunit amino acid permease
MGVAAPVAMSAITFAGSAQFAAVSILATGGSAVTAIAAAVLLNLRYGPIGVAVAPEWVGRRRHRLVGAQLIVDESWAIGTRSSGGVEVPRVLGAGLVLWAAWVGGTTLGVLAGNAIGDPKRLGLDAAFPALFLALVFPQLRTPRAQLAGLLGAGIALALVPLSAPGVPVVAASVACLIGLRAR